MDTIFRANVSQVPHLCTKNGLPEFIRGFRGFRGFPGNGPNRAGPALGSTRARGKDDGSLHKLLQIIPPPPGDVFSSFLHGGSADQLNLNLHLNLILQVNLQDFRGNIEIMDTYRMIAYDF